MRVLACLSILVMAATVVACSRRKHEGPAGGGRRAPEPVAPPPAAPPPKASAPNVLFVLTDDQRADSLSCMPRLRKLVGERGVTFSRFYATTPLCCPSRTSYLTGKYAHNHGVQQNGDTEDGDEVRTPGAVDFQKNGNEDIVIARFLREAGYRTGFVGKYLNGYDKMMKRKQLHVPPHWDDWYAFPHAEYYDYELVERPQGKPAERVCYRSTRTAGGHGAKTCRAADRIVEDGKENYSTDVLKEKALAFVAAAHADKRPFFLYLAPKAPHAPYDAPLRYQPELDKAEFTDDATKRLGDCPLFEWKDRPPSVLEADVSDKPPWVQELVGTVKPEKVDRVRKKQLVSVLAVEDALEAILAELGRLGIEKDTVVIFAGDNGYAWGEHHWIGKNCAYEECARVPLVVHDPRHPGGGRTEPTFALNVDLAPTIAELAGVRLPASVKQDGLSLVPLLRGSQNGKLRSDLLVECWGLATKAHPDIHSALRTDAWKYVEHYEDPERKRVKARKGGGREIELYDLRRDPHELDNLATMSEASVRAKGHDPAELAREMAGLAARLRQLGAELRAGAAAFATSVSHADGNARSPQGSAYDVPSGPMTAHALLDDLRQNWKLYASMPIVAAGIGYVTKLIAVRMMFAPRSFVGIRPWLGWQGIIPAKAPVMAGIIYDTLTSRLLSPQEVFRRLDPSRVVDELERPLLSAVEEITAEVASSYRPGLWESLPAAIRRRVVERVQEEAPAQVNLMMREIQENIENVFDLRDMMVTNLTRDTELLNRIFRQAGRGEFRFIERSGIYFGFAIGLLQAVAWASTHSVWIMPLFGGFIGWFSDWLALKMVFRPREPTRYLRLFTWQGLFLKRRKEVAAEYGALLAEEVLTARNIFEAALRGPLSDRLFAVVQRHVQEMIDAQAGAAKPLVVLAVGSERYQQMKKDIAARFIERMPAALRHVESYADEAMDIRNTLVSKLQELTAEEFEGVLRPVFEQDEWKLIAVGAVLGVLVGELQVFLMLHL